MTVYGYFHYYNNSVWVIVYGKIRMDNEWYLVFDIVYSSNDFVVDKNYSSDKMNNLCSIINTQFG